MTREAALANPRAASSQITPYNSVPLKITSATVK